MTEATVKAQAIELAGIFYEQNARSQRFRAAFPTVRIYLAGKRVRSDGTVERIPPGWMHHVVLARQLLARMLTQPDEKVSREMKDRIAAALIEDHGKSAVQGKKLAQHVERENGKAEQRLKAGIFGPDVVAG